MSHPKRMAYGVSDWPEEFGKEFEICESKPNETDEELIARAKSHYSSDLEVIIKPI